MKERTSDESISCCDPYGRQCSERLSVSSQDFLHFWSMAEQKGWWRSQVTGKWVCCACRESRLPIATTNLAILYVGDSGCYYFVVDLSCAPKGLTIDSKKGLWSIKPGRRQYLIGQSVHEGQVLGVYDRSDIMHLGEMVSSAVEASRSLHPCIAD